MTPHDVTVSIEELVVEAGADRAAISAAVEQAVASGLTDEGVDGVSSESVGDAVAGEVAP